MESKKIIVTGVSGQIGSFMVDFLLENTPHEVVGAIRRTSQIIDSHFKKHLDNPKFRLIHFDLCDPNSITNTIKNEKPDYFINLGAQTFVADSWDTPSLHFQTNALSVLHILEAVRNHCPQCRVYSSGSSEQFGDVDYSPQDIKHPFKPRSPYGASKAAAHNIVKVWRESYNLYAIQGILFNNESARRQDYFVTRKITKGVAKIVNEIREGKTPTPLELGNLEAKRDWSDAEDFVAGIWLMLNQEKPKEYVLASGKTYTIREFVESAFGFAGFNPDECRWEGEGSHSKYYHREKLLVKINPKYYRPAEVNLLLGDPTLAEKEMGWERKTDFYGLVKKMVDRDLDLL